MAPRAPAYRNIPGTGRSDDSSRREQQNLSNVAIDAAPRIEVSHVAGAAPRRRPSQSAIRLRAFAARDPFRFGKLVRRDNRIGDNAVTGG